MRFFSSKFYSVLMLSCFVIIEILGKLPKGTIFKWIKWIERITPSTLQINLLVFKKFQSFLPKHSLSLVGETYRLLARNFTVLTAPNWTQKTFTSRFCFLSCIYAEEYVGQLLLTEISCMRNRKCILSQLVLTLRIMATFM